MSDYPYEVGYGQPPKHTQFQPGQSGNPRGRPKNSRNVATILREAIQRKIKIKIDGESRKVPILDAIVYRLVEHGLTGSANDAVKSLREIATILPQVAEPESNLPDTIRIQYVDSDNAGGEFVATREERDLLLARRKRKAAETEAAKKAKDIGDDDDDPHFLN